MTTSRYPRVRGGLVLSRRAMLGRMGALAGAGLVGPTLLAACGGDDDDAGGGGGGDSKALWHDNWTGYMDEETIGLFKDETGIDLKYTELFDNYESFAKYQADLAAKRNIGPDIITPSNWLAARLIGLGWVAELPLDDIPNASNLVPDLQNPDFDPEGKYSLPYQSGMTGIAYNISETGRELKSIADLFDPEFKGRVGMLTEMRDTVGLTMLLTGNDPSKADISMDDADEAFNMIDKANKSGQIRAFTGNDYMDDLATGNYAACIGWSGDISQLALDNPDLKFAIPEHGGMRWFDTMVIPAGAENVANAAVWMNYLYDPENAARIEAYIGYNPPVEGVREVFAANEEWKAFTDSPLIFPDQATLDQLVVFANLDEDTEAEFDERFAEITGL
jgi:spermidine/putrescine transport system substrate-binding protein